MTKQNIIDECKDSYKKLLPNVHEKDLDEAITACYIDGMTKEELTKVTYHYLYPVNEPSLY